VRHRIRRWIVEAPTGTARFWLCLTILVSRFAATRRARVKMLVVVGAMPLRDRLLGTGRLVTLDLRYGGRRLRWLVGPKSDAEVMDEILVLGEYSGLAIEQPSVVLDLGSHAGFSLLFFRTAYPEARIVGIEPDPITFRRLRANVDQLDGVEVYPLALAPRDGPLDFYSAPQGWVSSASASKRGRRVTVDGRTLDTLLDELGLDHVDLMKIDIEGGEFGVLVGARRLRDVGAIVGELHDDGDRALREEVLASLTDFDVRVRGGVGEHTTFWAVRR
jgi:FkbM family methyltransferase